MSGFISEWGGGGGAFPFSISDLYRIKTKVLWSPYTYTHSFQPEVFAEGSIPWERLMFCFGLLTSFCFGFGEFQIIPESTFGNQGWGESLCPHTVGCCQCDLPSYCHAVPKCRSGHVLFQNQPRPDLLNLCVREDSGIPISKNGQPGLGPLARSLCL